MTTDDRIEQEGGRRRLRILVLTSTFPRWRDDHGPRFVFDLCAELAKEHDVHVLAPHTRGAATQESLSGVRITRFRYFFERWQTLAYDGGIVGNLRERPARFGLVPFLVAAECAAARRLGSSTNVDVIHAHWMIPQGLSAVVSQLGRRAPVPILCTSHGGDLHGLRHPALTWLKRWVLRRCQGVTVVSNAMLAQLEQLSPHCRRATVVPMGTDFVHLFVPRPEVIRNPSDLVFVGRLVEKKGVRYLIEALAMVRKRHPDLHLRVAGAGPETGRLLRQVSQLKMEDAVDFLGPIGHDQAADLYRSAGVAVVPSIVARSGDQEGFGLVIAEALGCECPVIASDLPAVHDLIKDEQSGLLARPADPAHLADRIAFMLEHPDRARRMGKAGRRWVVERFGWGRVGKDYCDLLLDIAGSGQCR